MEHVVELREEFSVELREKFSAGKDFLHGLEKWLSLFRSKSDLIPAMHHWHRLQIAVCTLNSIVAGNP